MTLREIFEKALIELNKVEASSLLLEDFNYLVNKAVQQKVNKDYNYYEINQQLTDNLITIRNNCILNGSILDNLDKELNYEVELPEDYFHILSCNCYFELTQDKGCFKKGNIIKSGALKLTSDSINRVYENYYFYPSYKKPYFFFINNISNLEQPKLEIKCGKNKGYELKEVHIEYLKKPQKLELTQEQIDLIEDNSQKLEWSDYMCYEIINELVKLLLENTSNPRLNTNIPINQTIGLPIPQQSKN